MLEDAADVVVACSAPLPPVLPTIVALISHCPQQNYNVTVRCAFSALSKSYLGHSSGVRFTIAVLIANIFATEFHKFIMFKFTER